MTEPDDVPGAKGADDLAGNRTPSPRATANALSYFMGEEPPPGSGDVIAMEVDFGKKGAPDFRSCTFRVLDNEQFVAAADAAIVADPKAPNGQRINPFVNWSYVVAYAAVDPDLGAILQARREAGTDKNPDGTPFEDTSALVRSIFRKRPGVLRAVMNRIDEESRMDEQPDKLVRLIEAGKDSP
jgi:hypothetical protein